MVKKFLNKINSLKYKKTYIYTAVLILFVWMVAVSPASAFLEFFYSMVGSILMVIVSFLGKMLINFIYILISIFQYTDFIDNPAVQIGWVIIRDVSNIIIVVMLMVIAFSNIIKVNRFSISQNLLRIIISAFLVNFSLLFTGYMIDASQVVMMHFVNGFKDIAAGNLTTGFGIEGILKFAENNDASNRDWFGILGTVFLAGIILIISIGVVLVIIVFILARIVILWFLAIFSPIAYIGSVVPGLNQYASQWWSNLSKQLVTGPMLAFGFWLSMVIMNNLANDANIISLIQEGAKNGEDVLANTPALLSGFSSPQSMMNYMVVIGLLMGTLWIAQQAGGVAGNFAGKVSGTLKNAARKYSGLKSMQDTFSRYKSMREQRSADKANKRASMLLKAEGVAKRIVASPVTLTKKAGGKIYDYGIKKAFGGTSESLSEEASILREQSAKATNETQKNKLEKQAKELEERAEKARFFRNPLAYGRDFFINWSGKWAKNRADKKEEEINEAQKEREKAVNDYNKIQELLAKLEDKTIDKSEEEILKNLVGASEDDKINKKAEDKIKELLETIKQQTNKINDIKTSVFNPENYRQIASVFETATKGLTKAIGLLTRGAIFSTPILGNLFVASVAGKKMEESGKRDLEDAADYIYKGVTSAKDAMGDMKDADILKIMNDVTASSEKRMAAIIKAFENKLINTPDKAIEARNLAGSLGADSKTMNTINSHIARQFPQQALTRDEVVKGIETGKVDINQMQPGAFSDGEIITEILKKVLPSYLKDLIKKPNYSGSIIQGINSAIQDWKDKVQEKTGKKDNISEAVGEMFDGDKLKDQYADLYGIIEKLAQVGSISDVLNADKDGGLTNGYKNILAKLVKGKTGTDILKNMKPGDLQKDILDTVAENIDLAQLRYLANIAESNEDRKKVEMIAKHEKFKNNFKSQIKKIKSNSTHDLYPYVQ